MEQYIKNSLSDITYMSELTQPFLKKVKLYFRKGGVNSPNKLTFPPTHFRALADPPKPSEAKADINVP